MHRVNPGNDKVIVHDIVIHVNAHALSVIQVGESHNQWDKMSNPVSGQTTTLCGRNLALCL